jgi:endonuclease/exonuclease/phosphatase family metal-dependent hydrolase
VEHLEEDVGIPTLVVGDLNMHEDPHTKLRILHDSKKVTFPSTGENLDHVGWLPLEWVRDAACLTCATLGPRCVSCRVHTDIWWSDHHPVEYTIYLPLHQRGRGLG